MLEGENSIAKDVCSPLMLLFEKCNSKIPHTIKTLGKIKDHLMPLLLGHGSLVVISISLVFRDFGSNKH
jgi:hypothetical protein